MSNFFYNTSIVLILNLEHLERGLTWGGRGAKPLAMFYISHKLTACVHTGVYSVY